MIDWIANALMIGAFSNIWPIVVLPWLASYAADRTAALLPDPPNGWRAPAALTALPGLIMLSLCLTAVVLAVLHDHWEGWRHLLRFQGAGLLGAAILGRGIMLAVRRHREFARLVALSEPPSPRLRAASAGLRIDLRQLPAAACECFAAGVRRPVVFVSAGMLREVSDSELRAALCHERAHVRGRDPIAMSLLAFLRDIVPGPNRAFGRYSQARERIADVEAVKTNGQIAVASALLKVARNCGANAPALSMASSPAVLWRMQAILGEDTTLPVSPAGWASLALTTSSMLSMIGWPYFQMAIIHRFFCQC